MVTVPESGLRSVVIMRRSTDLPEPFGPVMARLYRL